jgi:hypothetical protein
MEKWPEILLPRLRDQNDNCGTGFAKSTTATSEKLGKTNLGFLMRVIHALFIALLTAFAGCILAVFNG